MKIIKWKNGSITINSGAGSLQGDNKLIRGLAALLEKQGTNVSEPQANKTGDTIIVFEHELDALSN